MTYHLSVLDVQHGDTVFISTRRGAIGLVDCCKLGDRIPAIEFLTSNNIREIAFICLTHHHQDHYSGMLELIEHCVNGGIAINEFIDSGVSAVELDKAGLEFADQESADYFVKLFKRIKSLNRSGTLHWRQAVEGSIVFQETGLKILAVAPFSDTIRELITDKYKFPERTLSERINRLSIVLSIESGDGNALLLGDSSISEQKKILGQQRSLKRKIGVFKVSHHASRENFHPALYQNLKIKGNITAMISAGCRYNLPSIAVINDLVKLKGAVYVTNSWGSAQPITDEIAELGLRPDLEEAVFSLTDAVPRTVEIMPYHGDIKVQISAQSISVATQTGLPPIVATI